MSTNINFKIVDVRDKDTLGKYEINLFGRTREGRSVCATLTNYSPNFYVKLEKGWEGKLGECSNTIVLFYKYLNKRLNYSSKTFKNGDMVSLTDNSTNSPISWSWEITNGVNTFNSPMQNPMLAHLHLMVYWHSQLRMILFHYHLFVKLDQKYHLLLVN